LSSGRRGAWNRYRLDPQQESAKQTVPRCLRGEMI
jgi:hypothetical protein